MIAKSSIEDLKQKLDIVDIISHYIEVRKQGASFVCICPFHSDKNPSLHINVQKGFYHCFACKAGGDAFKFVMEFEKVDFNEAVEKVANLSNFTLTYTNERGFNNNNLKQILPIFNAFYKHKLTLNREALHYLYDRGLKDEDISKFELGFSPSNEENLRLLNNEKIELDDALKVGIIKKNEKELYASFIKRIIFPIYDYKGLLVGFGGRSLNSANLAKYVNSPQSILFDKSRIFYAFNLAKDEINKKKEMIICEGYMDAICMHKAGFKNTVAVLGTALTQHHLPLIKRHEARVILCFDNDTAGINAAMKSAFLLSTNEIDGKVVLLQGGKDPAELVANKQEKMLYDFLDNGIDIVEFYIRMLLNRPLNSSFEKQKALESVQNYTFLLGQLIANSYENLVAQLLGVNKDIVKLSKRQRKSKSVEIQSYDNKNLAEFEVFSFLQKSQKAREDFNQISDINFFKHKNLLLKILQNMDENDSEIREFGLQNFRNLNNYATYLIGIFKVNLSFFNSILVKEPLLILKKQILNLLDKNLIKFKKELNENELCEFLFDFLNLIKNEENLANLEQFCLSLKKVLKQIHINIDDLRNLNNETSGPF
ncbi:DNA primase [Campylobacter sp. LR291e]|uniref:DNA primase n=1 Tax=unclassified Campylobacter TaxID=2593542 RepID=UPI0012382214|nr:MULTISPECIES: DNA primase [unclassified Campylobacter]KAA6227903.1 DNA primase [Campylobacter sp. LR185c]KAA6228312.1 DNA primase [Campylobacter sp. LR196d]KAA6229313.1 DNA primase [Campylobacter sp. LR291e]KAA8604409.1 DNA primase [Campylobacter sp. LR185c]